MSSSDRFHAARAAFVEANAEDPNRVVVEGMERPRQLVQAERLASWVDRLDPGASESLRLAAWCQHIRRWEIPRSAYPAGRTGYLKWRKDLSRFHADTAEKILARSGYDPETIERVRAINLKRSLKTSHETQTIEDALCLSFLEHELAPFAEQHPADKVVEILRKTWAKMSSRGHELALSLPMSPGMVRLVERALAPPDADEG